MAGSTPIYGFPYPQPSDLVANYPALGQELAEDVEAVISGLNSGMNLISPTSIANSGGTATSVSGTVTFTNVTSLSLNGVFTSSFQNYRILLTVNASVDATATFRYRTSGSDNSTSSYSQQEIYADGASVSGARSINQTSGRWMGQTSSGANATTSMDVFSPQKATVTNWQSQGFRPDVIYNPMSGEFTGSTSFDGITFFPGSGNITGTVRVYGYLGA